MPELPPREIPEKFLVAFSFAGEQRDLVRQIAEGVEAQLGRSTVFFDEWYEPYVAGPDASKLLQDIYSLCKLAVVCISARYGGKKWPLVEFDAILARVNRVRTSENPRDRQGVLPIRVGEGDVQGIFVETWIVPDVRATARSLEKAVELIINRLRSAAPEFQVAASAPAHPPWPDEPVYFEHGLADRAEQWPAIQSLMTSGAAKRILMFKGSSGYSKTALLDAAASYAETLAVQAAYVDLEARPSVNDVLIELHDKPLLRYVLPNFVKQDKLNSSTLLSDLRQINCPILILLDTYEKIKDNKELADWIELQLLAVVKERKQLRFLIGGQDVPNRTRGRWGDLAEEIELPKITDDKVWMEWIRKKDPHMHEEVIKRAVKAYRGQPKGISEFLNLAADVA